MYKKLMAVVITGALTLPAIAAMPGKTKGNELERASCSSILDLFAAADPKSSTDKKAVAAAQDKTYAFVMWVHGYLSGRDGVDFAKRPLNQSGITQIVGDIYAVCQNDERRVFLDAIRDIR